MKSFLQKLKKKLSPSEFALQLLRVDAFRYFVAFARYFVSCFVSRGLRTLDLQSDTIGINTVSHNLKNLKALRSLSVSRSHLLIRPLSVIAPLNAQSRVLSVGPRSEGELLNLASVGFRPKNIRGLDLISYSKWVDLGDMHKMPYRDGSYDAIVLGWCLAYSNDRKRVAQEAVRVLRDGGVVAVGVEYNPKSAQEISKEVGYQVCDEIRMTSVKDILDLFENHVRDVYFTQDVPPSAKNKMNEILAIFSINKDEAPRAMAELTA